jgi:hypothetical protein
MTQEQEMAQLRAAIEAGETRWMSQMQEMDRLKAQLIEAQRVYLCLFNSTDETIRKLRQKVKKLRAETK